jgi:hypothetical protein
MSTKVRSIPKFPKRGWIGAGTRLKGFTAKAVQKIKDKRAKAQRAAEA